jgi:hypothetical protein
MREVYKAGDRVMVLMPNGDGAHGTVVRILPDGKYDVRLDAADSPYLANVLLKPYDMRPVESDHDVVAHPSHYTSLGIKCKSCDADIECIDVVEHMIFNLGNVVKYVWRVDSKDEPIENLKKARQYLDFEIAKREREAL